MRAMILAAGRGERMRPLTDSCPKPLLPVGGRPLIEWHLLRLARAGLREVVINHAHLGQQIEATVGDGRQFGLSIRYSPEPPGALETAGGMATALPLLGEQPFLAVNGDIWCDWDFARARRLSLVAGGAHLVMVGNPPHHPHGDFRLDGDRLRLANAEAGTGSGGPSSPTLTYAGIGVFSPAFFAAVPPGVALKLRPLLDAAIPRGMIGGERHDGRWIDIGTAERLTELDRELRQNA